MARSGYNDEICGLSPPKGHCRLHPLIHTFPTRNLTQDIEKKKAEPKTPHFLSLNQDIVAWSQEEKCGLKYVIHIQDFHSLNGSFWPKSTVSRPIFGLISSLFHLIFNYLAWPDHGPSRVVRFGFLFGHYIRAILDIDFFKTTIS